MTPFAWIDRAVSFVAGAAIMLVLSLIYWNGLPYLNEDPSIHLPIIGEVSLSDVPVLGDLAVGHLAIANKHAAEAATKDLVSKADLASAEARAAFLQHRIEENQKMLEAAQIESDRLDAVAKENANGLAQARASAAARADPDAARWTDADVQRVHDYRAARSPH